MADRKISDLTALTAPASGDYLPIVDISEAAAANKNKRITIEELFRGVPLGTAAAPSIAIEGDEDTGVYSPGANQLAISTGGSGRLFVDASGNVGLGITPVANTLLGGARGSSLPGLIELAGNGNTVGSSGFAIGQDGSGVATLFQRANAAMYFATNGSERLRITSTGQLSHIGAGSSSTPAVSFSGSAPVNSLVVDSSGRCGMGTSNVGDQLDVAAGNYRGITVKCGTTAHRPTLSFFNTADSLAAYIQASGNSLQFGAMGTDYGGHTPRMTLSSTGLGIGVTNPGSIFDVKPSASSSTLRIEAGTINSDSVRLSAGGTINTYLEYRGYLGHAWFVDATERARIDSSGRLLVGTSTASTIGPATACIQSEVTTATWTLANVRNTNDNLPAAISFAKSRGTTAGSVTTVENGDGIGALYFYGANGSNLTNLAATIAAEVDGVVSGGGANDMPGRLVFSTTADGASSPTERMRIQANGIMRFGQTTTDTPAASNVVGAALAPASYLSISRSSDLAIEVNRVTNDGKLMRFLQDGTEEGDISVSGTTVSYNGGHLSRWSQLPSGVERTEILRGSVLSNIDEMCEWGNEENEQLNRMKVSDVEGDKNVSGVFQGWDDDDDTYTNDFYCAMTGDFVIRIAAGVTVERGDLLMSAGDGTAKPQADDLVRSCTIAKVTSTTVSCTYEDGSYCVPCVLMAC